MRKILTFASLVLLGSVVGCQHANTGCSSCGCGQSACGGTAYHHPCTFGVCDCDVPPLAPYGRNLGAAPVADHGPATVAAQPSETPRLMPQALNDASGN
jgi:hypothetical protein